MSDHRPPLFADGDITPPRGSNVPGSPGESAVDGEWDEWDDEEWDEPNYLVRRALIVLGVVVAIAVIAVVASRFIGGGSDSSNGGPDADWNSIVVIDPDAVRILDADGELLDTFDGEYLDDQLQVSGNTLVAFDDTDGRVTLLDLTDGSRRTGRASPDMNLRTSSDNEAVLFVESFNGGDVTLIDTSTGEVISIADVADLDDPFIFSSTTQVNAGGTHAGAPVPRLFQSVVIDIENETSTALGGRVIAIDDTQVITEQPAGGQSELEFYDLTGERLGSVDVPAPIASMITSDGSMLLVSANGVITRATPDSAEQVGEVRRSDGATLEISAGSGATGTDRMVVVSNGTAFIIAPDGTQIASITGSVASDPTASSQCLVMTGAANRGVLLIDLETGEILVETNDGFLIDSSVDGCTAAVRGSDGPVLLRNGEILAVEGSSFATLAPDGGTFTVTERLDVDLYEVGNDGGIEIANTSSVVFFTER